MGKSTLQCTGIIYLISSLLFGTSYHKGVNDLFFYLVESNDMKSFPCGKELYNVTLSSLKSAINKK